MASRGYFLITDVSGYTAFMTGSELEHAHDILNNLFGAVLEKIAAAWERDREARRVYVGAAPGLVQASVELPVGPAVAWEYLTAPNLRSRWEGADGMSVAPKKDGRVGEGSVVGCVRGKRIEDFPIVDWRPFEYFTEEHRLPWVGKVRTTELSATTEGTRVSWRYSRPLHGGLASAKLGRVASRLLAGALERDAQALLALARRDAGKRG